MIILKQMPTLVIIVDIAVSSLGADVVKTFEEIALFFLFISSRAAAADVMFNVGAPIRTAPRCCHDYSVYYALDIKLLYSLQLLFNGIG